MADDKPDWMEEAEKAGWTQPGGPQQPPVQEPPAPQWMEEARAAGWTGAPPAAPPEPEPQWMAEARAAGWDPAGQPMAPAPMPMHMAMAPPPGPPMPPAPPAEQPSGNDKRGWVIAASAAIVLLVLGIGAAVVIAVSGGDDKPTLVAPPTQPVAETTPKSVTTVIIRPKAKKHKKKSTTTPTYVKPIAPVATSSNSAADRVAIENVLSRHFQNLVDGNYSSSYNDLTGSLATNASSWIDAQRQDGLYDFSLNVSPQVDGTSATANIVGFTTKAADSGCHTWSGSWQMTKVSGSWKISQSNLSRGNC